MKMTQVEQIHSQTVTSTTNECHKSGDRYSENLENTEKQYSNNHTNPKKWRL